MRFALELKLKSKEDHKEWQPFFEKYDMKIALNFANFVFQKMSPALPFEDFPFTNSYNLTIKNFKIPNKEFLMEMTELNIASLKKDGQYRLGDQFRLYQKTDDIIKTLLLDSIGKNLYELLEERLTAKNNKDYKKADSIRNYLMENDVKIEDTKYGYLIYRKIKSDWFRHYCESGWFLIGGFHRN